jgi:hypothetical protein
VASPSFSFSPSGGDDHSACQIKNPKELEINQDIDKGNKKQFKARVNEVITPNRVVLLRLILTMVAASGRNRLLKGFDPMLLSSELKRKAPASDPANHTFPCYNRLRSTPTSFRYRQIAGFPRFPMDKHPSLGVQYAVKHHQDIIHQARGSGCGISQPEDHLINIPEQDIMTKERKSNKEDKKKPAMTPKEKKTAKKSKKETRNILGIDRAR